ncbi:MAG: NIL domain-containing protein [Clostridiales bacterium]
MVDIMKKVILNYSSETVEEPIVYILTKEYNLIPNIVKANVNPEKEGYMVLELTGQEENYQKAIEYLRSRGMSVKPFAERVVWDEKNCTQCGACTGVCPSGALTLKRPEMTIVFNSEKCVICNMCIQACPINAVRQDF